MNFAAADENRQIINKRQGKERGEEKLWGNQAKRREGDRKKNAYHKWKCVIQG